MPKKVSELSAVEIRQITKPGLHRVGGVTGLMLQVSASGSKSWILRVSTGETRYSKNGKPFVARRDIGLGGFPSVTLSGAREAAREVRKQLARGVDPIAEKKAAKEALRAAREKRITFAEAARRCHATKVFSSAKHGKDWINSLEGHAFAHIADIPVAKIELPHILKVLEPIWWEKTETATRVRQRLESVLKWATVAKHRTGENPAKWKDNLEELLPAPKKITKVKHHAALPWQEVPGFMADLRKCKGMTALALEFAILTASRSSEVRGARWSEIDINSRVWTVPADRIKSRKLHRVPLSDAAVKLLESMPRIAGSDLVFTAPRGGELSDTSLLMVVRRMEVEAVPHGFRSTFKDWCRNTTAYADEVSELALAHVNSDATRAAYARDELLPKRAKLMQDWARYLAESKAKGEVVGIREARA